MADLFDAIDAAKQQPPPTAPATPTGNIFDQIDAAKQAPAPGAAPPATPVDARGQSAPPAPGPLSTFRRAGPKTGDLKSIFDNAVDAVKQTGATFTKGISQIGPAGAQAYQAEQAAEQKKLGITEPVVPAIQATAAEAGQLGSTVFDTLVQGGVSLAKAFGADDSTQERIKNDLNTLVQSEMGRSGDPGLVKSSVEGYLKEKAPPGTAEAFSKAAPKAVEDPTAAPSAAARLPSDAVPLKATSPGVSPMGPPATPDPTSVMNRMSDRFFQHRMGNVADKIELMDIGKPAMAAIPDAATREKLIHYQEQPGKIELTPEEKSKYDKYVLPVIRKREAVDQANEKWAPERIYRAWTEGVQNYAPRYVKGKGSALDWLYYGQPRGLGRSLGVTAGFIKKRTVTEPMIERPEIPYYKDVVVNNLARLGESQRINRNFQMLEDLKTDPDLFHFREPVKGNFDHPDWQVIKDIPQISEYRWHPKIAAAIKDYWRDFHHDDEGANFLERVNRTIVGSLFIQPWAHVANVFNDFLISKGLLGTITGLPQTAKAFARAVNDVRNLTPEYRASLREGSSLQYGGVVSQDLVKFLTQKLVEDGKKNPHLWSPVARAFGYADPVKFTDAIYGTSRRFLWAAGDMLKLTRQYELEAQGMSRREAIGEAEKHIINYRIPSEVLSSRVLSRIMQDRQFTIFNPYHYGILRSLGHTMRDAVKGTPAEKLRALDSMAMIAAVNFLAYQGVDQMVRKALGNQNAYVRRYGVFGLLYSIQEMLDNKKDARDVVLRILTPGPLVNLPEEILYGRDPYTGKPIYRAADITEHPTRFAKEIAAIAGSQIYPIQQALQVLEGKRSLGQIDLSQIGIYSPTPQQVARTRKARTKEDRASDRYFRKLYGQ